MTDAPPIRFEPTPLFAADLQHLAVRDQYVAEIGRLQARYLTTMNGAEAERLNAEINHLLAELAGLTSDVLTT